MAKTGALLTFAILPPFQFPDIIKTMNQDADLLRRHVERKFECRANLVRVVATPASNELYAEELLIHVFDLVEHPVAKRAYAWRENGCPFAVQHGWFVRSPEDAVREAHATPTG